MVTGRALKHAFPPLLASMIRVCPKLWRVGGLARARARKRERREG